MKQEEHPRREMSVRKSQSLRISRSSFSQYFTNDLDIEEECRFAATLYQNSTENNYELVTSNRRRPIKNVAIQTTPEVDERDYSWLLNMENKADALCADVSNLLNTLLQAKSWDCKRRRFEQNPLSYEFILNGMTGDKKEESVESELNGATNLSFTLMLQNIENKLTTVLTSATQLRNSIPIVSTFNVKKTSDKSVQTVTSERKNITMDLSELNRRESWIPIKIPNQSKTKKLISTEKAVTFKLQRAATQIYLPTSKNRSMLKQISSLNSKWKDMDFTTAKTSSNSAAKKILETENEANEKDMGATGAIPKKTLHLHMKAPIIHKRTDHQVIETSKTKQVPSQKPVWR